ncbi:hypothetical protein [Mucilaginibacter segetis]|uniref:Uncharacterized protein n=1 Tax=Mucilaginibacter segetis TaxID=2793071 RepID=A0A934PNQ3_9SPHI|nr:hypothetical protein [Mucilaginibacter segetis]MBK0377929.1 hypothetical protein [Mucilaginibacter segetis]
MMKYKALIYILIFISCLSIALGFKCESHNTTLHSSGGLKKILELDINKNPLTKGLSVYTFDIYNDTLYVANKGDFLGICLKNGLISKNLKVSSFLKEKFKSHIAAGNIRVRTEGYYLSLINDLYFINRSGIVKKVSANNGYMINDFNVMGDKIILASRDDKIKLMSNHGHPISTLSLEMADDGHVSSYKGLCYDSGDYIYEFDINKNKEINTKKYAPLSLIKEIKDAEIAFNSDKYFMAFSYYQRNKLYIIRKSTINNQIQEQINLGQNYFDKKALPDEGQPDFRIAQNNGINYLILIYNKKLEVFTFNL